jgi:ubiquinone/menaquinone biosynthesis C-methylase UbiE
MTTWDAIATGHDRTNTPSQMWLGNEGLRRAGLRPGMRFLDVAAGSGALSIPAARLGARVLATDLSPAMLALLEQRAREEELSIETQDMDGNALELEDAGFDMAGSQFGVMLFPDMPKGIAEMARVVKPGGRVLMSVSSTPATRSSSRSTCAPARRTGGRWTRTTSGSTSSRRAS